MIAEPHWGWLALGLMLAVGEMVIPGVFLIWLAVAAIVTGLIAWVVPIGVAVQVAIFAALAMISVFAGRNWLRSHPVQAADPMMNDRGGRAVGELVIVTHAIGWFHTKWRVGSGFVMPHPLPLQAALSSERDMRARRQAS